MSPLKNLKVKPNTIYLEINKKISTICSDKNYITFLKA